MFALGKDEQQDSLIFQEPHSVPVSLGALKIESRNISYSVIPSTIKALLMAADSYCAICGASLGITSLQIGSNSERAKRIRKEKIGFGIRKRADQTEASYYHEDSDSEIPEMEIYYIEHQYDPEVMACRDATLPNYDHFIEHMRLVIWGTVDGGHPDRPDEQFKNVVHSEWEAGQTRSFPCHELCLQIAAKVILGKPDSRILDPEVLYRVMHDDLNGGPYNLNLYYGDISTGEQYWECEAGEEYGVMNPLEFHILHMQTLVNCTIEQKSSEQDCSVSSTRDTTTDPFQQLSNELIHHVTDHLVAKDVFSLRQASRIIREATSGNSFWMPRVQNDMAWLWIPHDTLRGAGHRAEGKGEPQIDWIKVYLLVDSVTAHPYGMSGVYMGLANRRRTWNACEQLKSAYMTFAAEHGRSLTNTDRSRRTWDLDNEIDSLWSEALDVLESPEKWLSIRGQAGRVVA
ncbi:hypothetical protein MBLNU13_g06628t2 [Cladosporium sp. NU13]